MISPNMTISRARMLASSWWGVPPDNLNDNGPRANRILICSRYRSWQRAPQPIAMLKQQDKALVAAGCQEGPGVSGSPSCGNL